MHMEHQITMYELLCCLRNFFPGLQWQFTGEEIRNGALELPELTDGDYYLMEGSRRNSGLHVYGDKDLKSECFSGTVTEVCVPKELRSLWAEINEWQRKNAEALESPYISESFGGYSYTKAGGSSVSGDGLSWKMVFGPRLRQWRKL